MSAALKYESILQDESKITLIPQVAASLERNTEQLGAYLVQMAGIMVRMQNRLDELEEKQRLVTLSHDEVKAVQALIKNRSFEYCEKYGIQDATCRRMICGGIRKAILQRYGVKDLHDVPAIARQAVEAQISKWADIRLVMKCREKLGTGGD